MFASFPESGADPTIESDSGFNAMDMAVAMGHRNGMFTGIVYMLQIDYLQKKPKKKTKT